MRSIFQFLKINIVEFSTILCFVLPPLGILSLFIVSFVSIFKHLKKKRPLRFSLIPFFFVCLFISTIGAAYQMHNPFLLAGSIMVLGYWGLYQRIVSTIRKENFQHYRWIVIFGGLYNCLIASGSKWMIAHPLIGFLTGTRLIGGTPSTDYSRLIGSAYNPNFTMYLLLLSMAFIFAEMLNHIRKKHFIALSWLIPILLILSKGVIATGSRAGFFAIICIYFLFFFRLNKVVFTTSSILLLLLAKWLLALIPRNQSITDSFLVRKTIWKNSIELWKNHFLFGTTPFGFQQTYFGLFHDPSVPHAHNIFIGFFSEYGALGGIAFLILLCATIYKSVSLFFCRKKKHAYLNYFLLSLPIVVLTGVLDEPTFSPQVAMLTIILLAYWERYTKKVTLIKRNRQNPPYYQKLLKRKVS